MTKARSTYSVAFKHDAASLVLDKGYTIQEACDAVGVGYTAMRRWVAQLKQEHDGVTPTAKAMTPDQIRIQELEAKIKQIEWEKDILKKASALLIQDSIKR
ncbi:transposase [Photobacterium frigidiphilum]|jgi:transposase|nr:transposase [Photobacterium frigidiphilum]